MMPRRKAQPIKTQIEDLGIPIIDPDDIPEEPEAVEKKIIRIKERDVHVRIRAGAGINYAHVNGEYLGSGVFEVDEIAQGVGSMSGWGHLVNGKGWVALDFVEVLK